MTNDAPLFETSAALVGIEPLATAVARTADGEFTVRIFPGVSRHDRGITVVTNLDAAGHGEPYGTTLDEGETPQQRADEQAAGWIRARGAAPDPDEATLTRVVRHRRGPITLTFHLPAPRDERPQDERAPVVVFGARQRGVRIGDLKWDELRDGETPDQLADRAAACVAAHGWQ